MNQLGDANPCVELRSDWHTFARRWQRGGGGKMFLINPKAIRSVGLLEAATLLRITSDTKLVVIGAIGNLANDTIKLLMAHWLP